LRAAQFGAFCSLVVAT